MLLIIVVVLLIAFYLFCTKNHDYWAKKNVKHDSPIPLFGNHLINILSLKSLIEISVELYNKYPNEKFVGYYRGTTPELVVRDLDLIRYILSVDFGHFYHRGLGRKSEPLLTNLFHVDGDEWRLLRQRFTPAFTTAKLRAMFPLVIRCAERLQDLASSVAKSGEECDARELMARFATEFIGACGFGIEMDTINNQRSQFRELGKKIFSRPLKVRFLISLTELFPELKNILYANSPELEKSITAIVEQIRKQRNYKPAGRNDFVDLLLELEQKGQIVGESIEKHNPDGSPVLVKMDMDIKCMAAQVFIFFAAGFETSSSATSYALHKLALNPTVQNKVHREIDEVMTRYNNQLCYEAVAEMSYLDMTFKEAMRMFPSLGILNRVCARRYTIPGTDIIIDPGVKIIIPVQAIHMDEKYFDDPTEFRPERFSAEAVKERHNYAYLPFGEGPRACVGMFSGAKLGHMQSLAGLAALLHKFSVSPAPGTKPDPELDHTMNVVQGIQGGLPIILKARNE